VYYQTSAAEVLTAPLKASGGNISRLVINPKDLSVTVLNRSKKVDRW